MKKLYHFTSIDSFIKILNSQVLFFSNISNNSNDPSEGNYQYEYINRYVKQHYPNIQINLFNSNTTKNENLNLYTFSLSFDLNNIHNWMEYGNYGNGVAIEFDYAKLDYFIKNELFTNFNDKFVLFEKVYYNDATKNAKIREICDKDSRNRDENLLLLYPFLKHKSYKYEHEYRIAFVSAEETKDNEDCFTQYNLPNFCYISKYRHYIINLQALIEGKVITSIIIGPNVRLFDKNYISKIINEIIKIKDINIPIKRKSDN